MAIENQRWKYAGAKDQHIREQLGYGPTTYYAILNRLLGDAEVERRWPVEVRRIRRVKEARRRVRAG